MANTGVRDDAAVGIVVADVVSDVVVIVVVLVVVLLWSPTRARTRQ